MLVGGRMTHNPVTISQSAGIDDALQLMRERKVRRLPVIDSSGRMVGIVSDHDLLHAAPSPVTSLSVHELHYLLSKLTVGRVMSSPVITVTPDTPIEEAACIMVDNKIGGLPVIENGEIAGIITETDIFKVMIEALGAREAGLRVSILVPEGKGVLAGVTRVVSEVGGNIVSLMTSRAEKESDRLLTIKVDQVDPDAFRDALERLNVEIQDYRVA